MFDPRLMTETAVRIAALDSLAALTAGAAGGLSGAGGLGAAGRPTAPRYAVDPALATVLPDGLRRGSTVAVAGSVSLLLAVVGMASSDGAWCALVGMPAISAEAAHDIGVELTRLPLVPDPGARWVEVVGALVDAMDVVVARVPARLADGDIRRLVARGRSRGSVLIPFLGSGSDSSGSDSSGSDSSGSDGRARWPHADVRLTAHSGAWSGIGDGYGRLRRRQVTVVAEGRGVAARRRTAILWLPAATGGVEAVEATPAESVLSEPAPVLSVVV
jgi:hypothetical protein